MALTTPVSTLGGCNVHCLQCTSGTIALFRTRFFMNFVQLRLVCLRFPCVPWRAAGWAAYLACRGGKDGG